MDELKPCPISPDEARDAYFKLFDMQFDAACDAQSIALGRACGVLDWIASGPDRRAAPENKPLALEQLRGMEGDWVWLINTEHSEYDGWYNVRPFHDGSGGVELYGVDNNYYERAITAGSVKVYARKPGREQVSAK